MGDWVVAIAGLNSVKKRKVSGICRKSNIYSSIFQLLA
jgi:hypothetical protein